MADVDEPVPGGERPVFGYGCDGRELATRRERGGEVIRDILRLGRTGVIVAAG